MPFRDFSHKYGIPENNRLKLVASFTELISFLTFSNQEMVGISETQKSLNITNENEIPISFTHSISTCDRYTFGLYIGTFQWYFGIQGV